MNWNDIKKSVTDLAGKATKKTEELADLAAIKIKAAKKSSDKEGEFLKLGKLTYKKLTAEDDSHDAQLSEKISASVNRISALTDEISALNAEYEQKKREAEAQKKAKKSQETEFGADEINTEVLDSFSDVEE